MLSRCNHRGSCQSRSRMLKRPSSKAAASKEARRYQPHFVWPFAREMDLGERITPSSTPMHLSDARTPLADFFSILLVSLLSGHAGGIPLMCTEWNIHPVWLSIPPLTGSHMRAVLLLISPIHRSIAPRQAKTEPESIQDYFTRSRT